jgi:shikimate kinase
MDLMNRTGITIYLQMPAVELVQRLMASKHERPLIKDKDYEELIGFVTDSLAKREVWYKRATIIFPVRTTSGCPSDYSIETITEDLIKQINGKRS